MHTLILFLRLHWRTRAYYQRLLHGTEKFPWLLAFLLLSLLATVRPAWITYTVIAPLSRNLEQTIRTTLDEIYPAELEVTIADGKAKSNVTEPYYITIKPEVIEHLFSQESPSDPTTVSTVRLLAIDTQGRAEDFESYQSLVLLTETSLVYYDDDKINIASLREFPDLQINKPIIQKLVHEWFTTFHLEKIIRTAVLFSPVLFLIGNMVAYLVLTGMYTIGMWLTLRCIRVGFRFQSVFQVTAAQIWILSVLFFIPEHIVTIPILTDLLTIVQTVVLYTWTYSVAKDTNQPLEGHHAS